VLHKKCLIFFLKFTKPTPPLSLGLVSISLAAEDCLGVSILSIHGHCQRILSMGIRIPSGKCKEHKKKIDIEDKHESTN
jgi:hypothetical protein